MLKCLSMQIWLKIYYAVQELWTFSLKYLNQLKCCLAKPCHHFEYQWLDNVNINKYAKFDPNILCGSRVMSIFTNVPQPAGLMLSKASSINKITHASGYSVGAKSQILSSVASPGRKTWSLFSVRDMSWGLRYPCFTKFSVVNFL